MFASCEKGLHIFWKMFACFLTHLLCWFSLAIWTITLEKNSNKQRSLAPSPIIRITIPHLIGHKKEWISGPSKPVHHLLQIMPSMQHYRSIPTKSLHFRLHSWLLSVLSYFLYMCHNSHDTVLSMSLLCMYVLSIHHAGLTINSTGHVVINKCFWFW